MPLTLVIVLSLLVGVCSHRGLIVACPPGPEHQAPAARVGSTISFMYFNEDSSGFSRRNTSKVRAGEGSPVELLLGDPIPCGLLLDFSGLFEVFWENVFL